MMIMGSERTCVRIIRLGPIIDVRKEMKGRSFEELTRDKKFLFFGGKGGVGKTTMAAATAVWFSIMGSEL